MTVPKATDRTGQADLIGWLRAQLDEDERLALAWKAESRRWQYVGTRRLSFDNHSGDDVASINVAASEPMHWEQIWIRRATPDQATHVARHDPARVLAEVDAKRRILDLHARTHDNLAQRLGLTPPDMCGIDAETWPCLTVRLLAEPYADRPGYQERWRP